jgi:hypothetical protein
LSALLRFAILLIAARLFALLAVLTALLLLLLLATLIAASLLGVLTLLVRVGHFQSPAKCRRHTVMLRRKGNSRDRSNVPRLRRTDGDASTGRGGGYYSASSP